jgi:hypothetical protein
MLPEHRRKKQEDLEFEASLGYIRNKPVSNNPERNNLGRYRVSEG